MRKDAPKSARISRQKLMQHKIDDFFSNFGCQKTHPEEGF